MTKFSVASVIRGGATCAVLGMMLWAGLGCDKDEETPDAVTQATYAVAKDVILPPEGDGYEVVGKVEGLNKFVVKYSDKVYRGGQPISDKGMKALKSWGIKTIISVTPDDLLRKFAEAEGMELVEVPIEKGKPLPAETLAKFLAAFKDKPGLYYIHCMGGSHRAGVLCLAYRVHVEGWAYDKALIEFGRLGGRLKDDYVLAESVRKMG